MSIHRNERNISLSLLLYKKWYILLGMKKKYTLTEIREELTEHNSIPGLKESAKVKARSRIYFVNQGLDSVSRDKTRRIVIRFIHDESPVARFSKILGREQYFTRLS
jgi:hypothetical protein